MMTSFEWNMTLMMAILLTLVTYNHIRVWKIKEIAVSNSQMLSLLIDAYIEYVNTEIARNEATEQDCLKRANSEEISEWDNV